MKKKMLFVVGSLTIGGIETYISRLTIHLKQHFDIYVLVLTTKRSGGLFEKVAKNSKVIFFQDVTKYKLLATLDYSALNHSLPIDFNQLEKVLPHLDAIHSVDSETTIAALTISNHYRANLLISSYHPREYVWGNKFYFRSVQKALVRKLCPSNIFYMNEAVKRETVNHLIINGREGDIIPLGVDLATYKTCQPSFKSNKIVSVGRLVDFKTYNEVIIKNMDRINERCSRNFEFHIYGEGPLRRGLEQLAAKQKSEIVFHGSVEYQRLPEIFMDTFVFVGVGTSIIESSAAGIPSVIGTGNYNTEESYGLFCDHDNYLVGEACYDCNTIPFLKLFVDLCNSDQETYSLLSERHRQKAERFEIEKICEKLIEVLDREHPNIIELEYSRLRYFSSNICWLVANQVGLIKDRKSRYNMVI